jgi:hypothetical protein
MARDRLSSPPLLDIHRKTGVPFAAWPIAMTSSASRNATTACSLCMRKDGLSRSLRSASRYRAKGSGKSLNAHMAKLSRTKGANGERELCTILSDAFGQVVKRKLGQARDSGNDIDLPPFRIECKRRKRIANLYEWLTQAGLIPGCNYAPDVTVIPVVALRADGKDWLITMRLSDWIKLAREEISK